MKSPKHDRAMAELGVVGEATRQHNRVAAALRQMINDSLKPGEQLPPVRQLMKAMNVSMPTVRAAQALLQQDGLLDIRHGAGAFVAEHARQWRIGIYSELDLLHPRTGHCFRSLASSLMHALRELGAEPDLYNGTRQGRDPGTEPTCPRFWADVEAGRLDGAVLLNVPSSRTWEVLLRDCKIPVVGQFAGSSIRMDTETPQIVRESVECLADQGCQRVALMTWELERARAPFLESLAARGMTTDNAWIKGELDPVLAGAGWDQFREIWFAHEVKPDGIVILDDMLFLDAQMAIFELGLHVPEQLRIVVQMNRGSGLPIRLPVNVYELDAEPAGRELADALVKLLQGKNVPPHECFQVRRHFFTTLNGNELVTCNSGDNMALESKAKRNRK